MELDGPVRLEVPDRTLTVKNPWASYLAYGVKMVEVRSWATKYRGWILIHASQRPDRRGKVPIVDGCPVLPDGEIIGMAFLGFVKGQPYTYTSFVGDGPLHLIDPSWFERGLTGWRFYDAQPLKGVPTLGTLNVWRMPEELRAKVAEANPDIFEPVVLD